MARDRPRIVVIGGGASGFMGAIEAGRTAGAGTLEGEKAEVIILEGGRQVSLCSKALATGVPAICLTP